MEWYRVCWPRLTAKCVEPVVSISWASCFIVGMVRKMDRTLQFSGLFPVRLVISLHNWLRLTFIVSFTNLTAFALYNHSCYNIEILIKLLTFFYSTFTKFFLNFLSRFYVFNVFFTLIWTFFLHLCLGMPLWYPKQMSKSRISDNNTQFDFRRIYWLIYLLFRFCCWRSATLNILLLSTVDIKLHTYIHTQELR